MLIPITPHIQLVQAPNHGRFPYANSLLIQHGGVTALIDAGCGAQTLRELHATYHIDMIICSHTHTDHTGGCWVLEDCPVWLPAGIGYKTGGSINALAQRFLADEALREQWKQSTVPYTHFQEFTPDYAFASDHVFDIGGLHLHSIHAPGHTADHTCFWEPHAGMLFTTDVDFSRFGPWYGNPEGNVGDFIASIEHLRALQPKAVVSSHKGVFSKDVDQLLVAFARHFARRDALILAACESPRTLAQLVDQAIIYGRFPRAAAILRYFEAEMLQKHICRLVDRQMLVEIEAGLWQVAG